MLEKILIGVTTTLMLLFATAVVFKTILVIVGDTGLVEGKLTRGDILTSVSIAVAALGAIGGWILTSQHRQDDIERLAGAESRKIERLAKAERDEAEQVAMANVAIIYERLNPMQMAAMGLLYHFVPAEGSGLIIDFPASVSAEDAERKYKILESRLHQADKFIPSTDDFYKGLHSLYVYRPELGKKFVALFLSIRALKMDVDGYLGNTLEENLKKFSVGPNTEKRRFFELLIGVVSVLIEMDSCRNELKDDRFSYSFMKRNLMGLKNRLETLQGVDENGVNEPLVLTPASYLKMLGDAERYFESRSDEFFDLISSGAN